MLAPAPISKTSFIFAVIIIAWCTLSVLPVYLELGSQTARIVTTILGSIAIYNSANAYSVFLYMLSGATGAHVADTHLYLDVENPWLSIIISIQSFLGTVFNICVISLIILLGA